MGSLALNHLLIKSQLERKVIKRRKIKLHHSQLISLEVLERQLKSHPQLQHRLKRKPQRKKMLSLPHSQLSNQLTKIKHLLQLRMVPKPHSLLNQQLLLPIRLTQSELKVSLRSGLISWEEMKGTSTNRLQSFCTSKQKSEKQWRLLNTLKTHRRSLRRHTKITLK